MVIVPGTAFVELALTAGRHAGSPVVEELVLEAPLLLAERVVVQLQVTVGEPDDDGRREVAVYSRPEAADEDGGRVVTCHARGWLALQATPLVPFPVVWPPADARPATVDTLYTRLADTGYEYGPMFQGLRAAWHAGEDIYTEVALPEDAGDDGFAVHPALFDAALHGGLIDKDAGSTADLPFSWSGVRLGSGGGSRVRVRISPAEGSALRVDVTDESGALVVSVAKLAVRPVDPTQLQGARGGGQRSLFQLEWTPISVGSGAPVRVALVGDVGGAGEPFTDLDALQRTIADGAPAPDAVVVAVGTPAATDDVALAGRAATTEMLALLQWWLASERFAGVRLVVVTRDGVAVGGGSPDLVLAPVWGLVRSA
ncbi:polyketide synthase dehydratase domain-containing protein, partial [Micromonospora sp. DT201]|uniref:polyketide synthase dehydratase domain-containing protein n=1 Tax=Micromonospora sp. DT201 TaxID=3393442 RepID=UPI003CEC6BCF